jgi:alpha-N-arabinofuranosidase
MEIALNTLGPAPIDVKQGGQFIEPLCNLIPSMTAQQVAGDSFEEEQPWRFAFRPEVDKPYRPWYPSGAVHVAGYALDTEGPFNRTRSQRIQLPAAHARAGISQDGFYTRQGVGYHLHLHMRGIGNVPVFASLHGGGGTIAGPVELGRTTSDWRKIEATLPALRTSNECTLTIEFEGPGTLWLDRVYLIGEDAVLGIWRPDVVDALREMNPGIIRFGGSALEVMGGLEWEDCIGPWDRRAPVPIPFWGGLEPNFASLEEIVQLCQHIGAEALLCVRWTGKTPADAAAQVEYFNGSVATAGGRRRAQNGHVEPYKVRYWQVGNEVGGAEYERSLLSFAQAMKRVDPSIRIISSSTSAETLRLAGDALDYLCEHHYECGDLARTEASFQFLTEQARLRRDRPIRVAITEWNTSASDWGLTRAGLATLGNALSCARYHNLMQRHADLVEIAIRSNLADSFCSGVLQTGAGWLYRTPTYYTQQLYARAAGSFPLTLPDARGMPWPQAQPDTSATLSADRRVLRIYAVNSGLETRDVPFTLTGTAQTVKSGTVHTLRDRDGTLTPHATNTRDDPERIVLRTEPAEICGQSFRQAFAPLSLTLFELELGD